MDAVLNLLEQRGAQLHVARLVHAVDVAEGERRHVAAFLTEAERLDGRDGVLKGRVQVLVDVVTYAVFFATDNTDLDLEDRVDGLQPRQNFLCDLEVLRERYGRAIPHVRLEDRVATGLDLCFGCGNERHHEVVEGVLRAVVGVQRNCDGVVVGNGVYILGEGERTGCAVLHRVASEVVRSTRRDLNDSIGTGLGQALQNGVDGL